MFKTLKLSNGNFLRADFTSPSIFRIRLNCEDVFPEGGMVRYGIVDAKCDDFDVKELQDGESVTFSTSSAALKIDLSDGKATLLDKAGKTLLSGDKAPESKASSGFGLSFKLDGKTRLYGLGDETRDRIQKRGHKNKMVVMNVASYIPIPYVMSDCGWAIFLNTTMYHAFDAGADGKDSLSFKSEKGLLDYFLLAGGSMPDLLDKYTRLAGKPHLLPRWGYGLLFVCDERGVRARDVLYEAYEFRRHGIPCDTIGLEPDWMGKHYDYSIDKKWSEERFHIPFWLKPQQQGTFAGALKNMDFKLSLWLCCDYDFSEYEEAQLEDSKPSEKTPGDFQGSLEDDIFKDPNFEAGRIVRIDQITKPGVPWFDHLKKFVDDGASAFKLDGANQICFHPDRKWANGMEDCEMHNLYPLLYNKQMSLGFKEHTGRRSMIYSAGGYAGIQRYSATWAGDTGGDAKTLVSLLNHGLSGHSNTCCDMHVETEGGIHYGFLQPFSQVLGWHMYNEPWFLGERRLAMFKAYALLRYKLMPYIYSMAHVAAKTAMPIMRAMPLAFPDDPKADKFIHQYMFGDSFLVGAFENSIYLPEGEWIDYWTGKSFKGGREMDVVFPEDKGGPLFVKAGAVIPTQKAGSATGSASPEEIIWEVFPHGASSFTLLEDDGESYAYLEGKIAATLLECNRTVKGISLHLHSRNGDYKGMPEARRHSFKVLCKEGSCVKGNGVPSSYDAERGILNIGPILESRNGIRVEIGVKGK